MPCEVSEKKPKHFKCQFDVDEKELIEFDSKKWCIYHLPVDNKTGLKVLVDEIKTIEEFHKLEQKSQDRFFRNYQYITFPSNLIEKILFTNNRSIGVNLSYSVFWGDVNFKDIHFYNETNFIGTIFKGNAEFNGCTFTPDASVSFLNTLFESNVNFSNAKFHCTISFRQAVFRGKADFSSAEFYNDIDFSFAHFHSFANFKTIVGLTH